MPFELDVHSATRTALQFLLRYRAVTRFSSPTAAGAPVRRLGDCSAVFWWDDTTPVLEFPLLSEDGSASHGYVLVSGSRMLPPILEYSFEGAPLSQQLNSYLASSLASLRMAPRSVTWNYWSGLEIVAAVEIADHDGLVYFSIPMLEAVAFPRRLAIRRDPRQIWPLNIVERMWSDLEEWKNRPQTNTVKELWDRKPVRYQQGCDRYAATAKSFSLDEGGHYCEPFCIAGCYPVAWALLASCYKRINQNESNTKIWPNSTCWSREWPSSTNPSQCQEVSDAIWAFHNALETTCEGFSLDSKLRNATGYWRSQWNLPWEWSQWNDLDFGKSQQITDANQPYLFAARGPWTAYLESQYPDRAFRLQGKVGHGVACYGYDTSNQSIKICLGWGNGFADKWIEFSGFLDNSAVFVSRFGLTTERESKVSGDPAVASSGVEAHL